MSPPELIQVNGQDVPIITYRGRRVITLAQMDRVHGKKPGTAGRAFRLHRNKLIKDEEYFRLKTDEPIGDLVRFVPAQGGGKPIIVLAEAGYLLLVKTFTDDLAWKVQRELVSAYFRPAGQFAVSTSFVLPSPKLSQFVAEGKPMEKLIAFVARCTQAMSDFSTWRAFYSQWNVQHPIKRDLPHEVKVTFADDSDLLFSFMLEGTLFSSQVVNAFDSDCTGPPLNRAPRGSEQPARPAKRNTIRSFNSDSTATSPVYSSASKGGI